MWDIIRLFAFVGLGISISTADLKLNNWQTYIIMLCGIMLYFCGFMDKI